MRASLARHDPRHFLRAQLHSYPVNVVLWGSKAAGPGRQRYTKITELYPGVHPPYVRNQPATFSETLYP